MKPTELTGLPAGVGEHLEGEGVEELYPPQAEAVERGVTDGENVVAAVPTASGKTLIAELAMLSAVQRGGTALYIVPLRALASEKKAEFERWAEYGVTVGVSTGNYESDGEWLGSRDIVVATSEKVDSLIRNGAPWVDDLSCVVSDEVHLVDDRNRGPTLEVTLAKLRRINPNLQTVALSATVGNAPEIAEWLDAELVDSDWRPIDLRTGVHYGNAINFDDGSQREVPVDSGGKQTPALVNDTLEEGGSSLVFVNSRRNAESAATRLGSVTKSHLTDEERTELRQLAESLRDVSDTATSDDLADAVQQGAAFHHAGLSSEHRSLVEEAFRDRLIKVISATPTLAAGVNTPSRRVIVRDWRRYDAEFGGMKPLDTLEVHQMMGRAGRPGLDPYGEAVLLASNQDTMDELFERYVWGDPEPVRSKLAAEPALRTHLLATVASGFANSRADLLSFLDNTLYAVQSAGDAQIQSVTDTVLDYLEANEFIEREDDTITATEIGHTVSRLYLDPMSAATIIDGLRGAEGGSAGETYGANRTRPEQESAEVTGDASEGFTPASEMLKGSEKDENEESSDSETAGDTSNRDQDSESPSAEQKGDSSDVSEMSSSTANNNNDLTAKDGESPIHGQGTNLDDLPSAKNQKPALSKANFSALGLYHLVSRTPDMYQLYLKSGDRGEYEEVLFEREAELLGRTPSEYDDVAFEEWLAALKTARMLEDWASEVDESRMTERYGIGPGDIRGKVDTAQWLLNAAERLAGELDLSNVVAVREAKKRVEYGVREELLDLAGVRGVGRKRARRLFEAGVESRAALREVDKSVVLSALRGQKTAENVLENVGRENPSMADVETDTEASRAVREAEAEEEEDGQASLGDFG